MTTRTFGIDKRVDTKIDRQDGYPVRLQLT
jgi:hypothetical protein